MRLYILGCRGVPAKHGGFETFAEQFALYAVARGHEVTVACQCDPGDSDREDTWRGIRRLWFAAPEGPKGTVLFDLKSAWAASKDRNATILTLGYNTALFSIIHRVRGVRHFMNMDGVEWRRQKWSAFQRLWLRANEVLGANLADHLIADHPVIKEHLSTITRPERVSVIPYGADPVVSGSEQAVRALGLEPGQYDIVIARPEPENSLLEIVTAYASQDQNTRLAVLGKYLPDQNPYHAKVLEAAKGSNIAFLGAIYESEVVQSLRLHARAYVHGHQVGGTNPSLVEALAAGNAVIAHDNPYNRWVAGEEALFFSNADSLTDQLRSLDGYEVLLKQMQASSRARHGKCFRTEMIMEAYEHLLMDCRPASLEWCGSRENAPS